jgi:integrase
MTSSLSIIFLQVLLLVSPPHGLINLQKSCIISFEMTFCHSILPPVKDTTMNLQELYEATAPGLTRRDTNNLKTSIKYLAHALGKDGATECQQTDYLKPWPDLKVELNTFFSSWRTPPSAATVYNTRRNVHFLFQQPAAQHLAIPSEAKSRWNGLKQMENKIRTTTPYAHRVKGKPYRLPLTRWPRALQQGWTQYHRQVSLRIRDTTLTGTLRLIEYYMGYLIGIQKTPIRHWQELFKVAHADAFIRWVAARHHVRMTTLGDRLITQLCAIAEVQELPQVSALRRYKRSLPTPEPMHDKDDTTLTPDDLEQTGMILLAHARQPYHADLRHGHPGAMHAIRFVRGLIFRLLARHPLRARNIVELQLDTNLYRDKHGIWTLRFRPQDLKVSKRGGKLNTWRTPWPSDLVQDLEEYLTEHRPNLAAGDKTRYLFLNRHGRPYNQGALRAQLNLAMMKCTGKRFYTHLARHIYATHMRDEGVEVETVAYMLNNTPQVVYNNYYRTREDYHYAKAEAANRHILTKKSY